MSTEINTPVVIHNNIKTTRPRIDMLIDQVKSNDTLTLPEKAHIYELLNHCLVSTNGRSTDQKIQDLTEEVANIAAYSVANDLELKKLLTGMNDTHEQLQKNFQQSTKNLQDDTNKKFEILVEKLIQHSEHTKEIIDQKIANEREERTNYFTTFRNQSDQKLNTIQDRIEKKIDTEFHQIQQKFAEEDSTNAKQEAILQNIQKSVDRLIKNKEISDSLPNDVNAPWWTKALSYIVKMKTELLIILLVISLTAAFNPQFGEWIASLFH